jgi:hypothetical protein
MVSDPHANGTRDSGTATCHCGDVRILIPESELTVTSCNCSICRRYGALWAYFTRQQVRLPTVRRPLGLFHPAAGQARGRRRLTGRLPLGRPHHRFLALRHLWLPDALHQPGRRSEEPVRRERPHAAAERHRVTDRAPVRRRRDLAVPGLGRRSRDRATAPAAATRCAAGRRPTPGTARGWPPSGPC